MLGRQQVSACELFNRDFQSSRPTRVHLLTARHKALRLAWTRQRLQLTVEDLLEIRCLIDESHFQLYRADGRVRVWRLLHDFIGLICQQGTVQAFGASVMIWSMCSCRDLVPLKHLGTTLTSDVCVSILPNHRHLLMSIVHSEGLGLFQQDNTTLHVSRVATEWL